MSIGRHFAGFLTIGLLLAGCGYYTNVPAQIKLDVPSDSNITATVTYTVGEGSQLSADIHNPKIALTGEPGSIGVSYDSISIKYLPESVSPAVTIRGSIRVPSSHQFDENSNIVTGRVEAEIPVLSSKIVQLGSPLAANRITSQISAQVTLSGTDDAGFPASYEFFVPINFLTTSAVATN